MLTTILGTTLIIRNPNPTCGKICDRKSCYQLITYQSGPNPTTSYRYFCMSLQKISQALNNIQQCEIWLHYITIMNPKCLPQHVWTNLQEWTSLHLGLYLPANTAYTLLSHSCHPLQWPQRTPLTDLASKFPSETATAPLNNSLTDKQKLYIAAHGVKVNNRKRK